ncbi:hypothetical protein B296_00039569 [Ensete ventricosum]|uniref:Uncharacterized protein n=1 Tax=Ensete ventricosum TaxID=4639 RepID=A0A426ZSY6_ENSVE|nr:hypothetical protein B296_00039569 [Ensete ventricosum]
MPKRPAVTKHYLPLHSFPFPTYTTDVSLPASWLDGVMVRHAGPAGGMALISSKVGGRRSRWSIGVGPREVQDSKQRPPDSNDTSSSCPKTRVTNVAGAWEIQVTYGPSISPSQAGLDYNAS